MNFSRKTILVVGAALLAACGDKVTVQEYTPPAATAKVNSVEVAPATATLNIGQTITLTAAVNADAGLATTVTWASSDATKASVSTAGVVTAVAATPGVAVCATSTVDTGKKGCASIVVSAVTPTIPATVSINSITASGNLNGTVNPAAVAGAIDVTLNVNPGNQTISKVEVLFGGIVSYTQTFTAAQAAALRYAADEAAAAQTTFPQVVAPINTAAFVAATGIPTWMNGATTLQAKVYTTASGSSQAASASVSQTLTLANVNAFSTTTVAGGTTNAANNAAGFRYTRGDLTATIIAISYNGIAADNLVVNFGTAACDAAGANPQRTKTTTKTGNSFAATFANSGALAAGNLTGYSFNAGACAAANLTGEQFSIVAATDASGNAFTTTALPIVVGSGYRMDNLAPTVPGLAFTIVSVRNNLNWVNDAVPFNNTAANGGAIGVASTEVVGAGGVGLSTTNANVYDVTVGGNVITSAAGLAETLTNADYSATAKAKDLLGNQSAASGAATFGVDRVIPTIAAFGGPADATALAGVPNGTLLGAVTYADPATPPAGPSTPSATPVRMTIQRRTTATASLMWNNGAGVFNATGAAFSAGLAGVNLEPAGATNVEAYYVVNFFVEDGAANPSATTTRTYLHDVTAPTGPFSIPVATASAGLSNVYSSTAGDNLDVASTAWAMQYLVLGSSAPGAVGATILLPSTAFGSFASFTTTAASSANYPLFRSMTDVAGGVPVFANQNVLQSVSHIVTDRKPLVTTVTNAIPGANLPTMAAADPYALALFAGTGFSVTNAAVNVDISGNGVAPTLNSVNITATAVGTVNTMPLPFTRVDFFVHDAVSNTYRLLGSATSATVVDNAVNRVYTWTVNWDPGTIGTYTNPAAAGAQNVIAIGWNGTFDAVRSAVNANITTVP